MCTNDIAISQDCMPNFALPFRYVFCFDTLPLLTHPPAISATLPPILTPEVTSSQIPPDLPRKPSPSPSTLAFFHPASSGYWRLPSRPRVDYRLTCLHKDIHSDQCCIVINSVDLFWNTVLVPRFFRDYASLLTSLKAQEPKTPIRFLVLAQGPVCAWWSPGFITELRPKASAVSLYCSFDFRPALRHLQH